jgi:RNA polymerase sigma-70 factor, ECF subfamily
MDERVERAGPAAIVEQDAERDAEFDKRLRETATLAFRVAYGVLRQREDAEDVAQEAFARAYQSFETLRDRERFRPWLVRMTWRLAVDRRRADRRRLAREQAADRGPAFMDGERAAAASDAQARIWRAVEALPDKLRIVVLLANVEGHDTREVASLLGLPEGTVKSRLFAARKALAEQLQCLGIDVTKR